MNSITATELKQKIEHDEDFQLIDVREDFEHEEFNIGGQLIPLHEIALLIEKIKTDDKDLGAASVDDLSLAGDSANDKAGAAIDRRPEVRRRQAPRRISLHPEIADLSESL